MSFLRLTGLRKKYPDGTEAVKGVDLDVEAGEFVVLLGPSGCGKTTTLRMIAGLETATGGTIALGGDDVTALPPSKRDVGFVFQFYALYPHLTVRENVAFPLRCAGLPRAELARGVDEVVGRLGLGALLDRYPRQLSGGDQQRVALARAMVRHPKIYLMDEPLGTLDADRRLEMRELIRAQQLQLGVTTIYVTHDQEEAMSLADRIVVMEGGHIRQAGAPGPVYDRPADLFTAEFLGSPGMNFVRGRVADRVFESDSGALRLPLAPAVRPGPTTLGIRPESIALDPAGPLEGTVALDEYRGSSRNLHLDTSFGRIVLRTGGETKRLAGDGVRFVFAPEAIRFFDAESGASI